MRARKELTTRQWWLVSTAALLFVAGASLLLCRAAWHWRASLPFWGVVAQICQGFVAVFAIPPIIWSILRYRSMAASQRKAKHYQAWQAISFAHGKPGIGGRMAALQDLNADGQSLRGVNLSGLVELAGIGLPYANLADANLKGTNLRRANLRGTNFRRANLEGTRLINANLQDARFINASLKGANLTSANLQDADLTKANLAGADLTNAILDGADLTRANLEGASLRGAHLEGTNLEGAKLRRANLKGVDFEGANLRGANLQEADLQGANLRHADLTDANLTEANLDGVENFLHSQVISSRDWRGAVLSALLQATLALPIDAAEDDLERLRNDQPPPSPSAEMVSE